MDFQKPNYTYRATLDRVIDGDTIDVYLDLGCHTTVHKRLRFLELDTEELRGGTDESKAKAQAAKARVIELLEGASQIYVSTEMDDEGKYGRLLAYVWYEDADGNPHNLNTQMVAEGFQKVK